MAKAPLKLLGSGRSSICWRSKGCTASLPNEMWPCLQRKASCQSQHDPLAQWDPHSIQEAHTHGNDRQGAVRVCEGEPV